LRAQCPKPSTEIAAQSERQAQVIKDAGFVELKGDQHGLLWTHAKQINWESVKSPAEPGH